MTMYTEEGGDKFVVTAVFKKGGTTMLNERFTEEELPNAIQRIFRGEKGNIRSVTITQVERIRL